MKNRISGALMRRQELEKRIAALEADVFELRRHNVRLAEMLDLVQELLIPIAQQDEEKVQDAINKYRQSL